VIGVSSNRPRNSGNSSGHENGYIEGQNLAIKYRNAHAINKGQRYRYYVSAALITEAGTDRAQGRRIVPRVLGPRPERLSIGGALSSRPPSFD